MRVPPLFFSVILAFGLPMQLAYAQTQERYYLCLFGVESVPYRLNHTHTFAAFLRTRSDGGVTTVGIDTVSWLPASLQVRPLAMRPETGRNLTLSETFAWSGSFPSHVSLWG